MTRGGKAALMKMTSNGDEAFLWGNGNSKMWIEIKYPAFSALPGKIPYNE